MNPRRVRPPAYYNEIEPFAAEWLGNLSRAGHIARGRVDTRSIVDVEVLDEPLASATQAHFFAGIGVWSYALRLAGWPDDQPVWTGSCPCQPFSSAGKQRGFDDERHLWPVWFRLIAKHRPPVLFGEQVASRDGYEWLDLVQADLEGAGYAVGAAVLPAAGVGAPHIRHRIFFGAVRLADAEAGGRGQVGQDAHGSRSRSSAEGVEQRSLHSGSRGGAVRLADADDTGLEGRGGGRHRTGEWAARAGGVASPWSPVEWLDCRDGKRRPTQPGLFSLAHGAPARVGRLRAYGNAIVPKAAATFVTAFMGSL